MKKQKKASRFIAKTLSPDEIENQLLQIGNLIQLVLRNRRTSRTSFAYDLEMSVNQVYTYEHGSDMYLSTFLKLLHGLNISGYGFFKKLKEAQIGTGAAANGGR